ncbi:MAG: HAD superfamily hydrolase (TIGR01509 family) [Verrucomicrobiales bacterium]|jgi:HAD superfamily hydrolase (TIGR01509 family)
MKLDFPPGDFAGHIFDCDGTVVDSMPLHFHAWIAALEAHDAPFEFTEQYFYAAAGLAEADVTRRLNAEHGANLDPEGIVKSKNEWLVAHIPEMKSVPAVEAIVRKLAAEGVPIAVASGSKLRIVEPELEVVGLRDLFEIIITPEFVERGKPFPDMFLLAAEKMGVAPEKCLVYEDGQSGIDAATAAGMAHVYVPTGDARLAELAKLG